MEKINNSVMLRAVITSLYSVASRRTSSKFAEETIGTTIKTLEGKYDFLRYIDIDAENILDGEFALNISPDIETVNPELVGKSIEALIRVIYNDLNSEAGLYFVTELKKLAGYEVTKAIMESNADLDQVQLEQHYAYRRREKKKAISKATRGEISTKGVPKNLIGYGWDEVSYWKHEPGSKFCTLYNKQGKMLDRLNLDRIIQNYVERLSGYIDVDPREIEKETEIYSKEYDLLKLLLERDMDAETAIHMLKISKNELNNIIRKLSQMEMLQYVDYNTIELTDVGIGYISKKEKNKQ
ncbi:hypothetical protein AYK20_04225 [Thermoplasmatales archaeon SG8-52-1]|nr:MAG: hypothetical protein AYK20_04225 [Thermoplasmatales archaeon SG8-52-1]